MSKGKSTLIPKQEEGRLPRPAYETYYSKKAGRDLYSERQFARRMGWGAGMLYFFLKLAFDRTGDWVTDLESAALAAIYRGVGVWAVGRVLALVGFRRIREVVWTLVVMVVIVGIVSHSDFTWWMTVEQAQKEAVRRHPQLAVANSPLNREFVARYQRYGVTNPEYFQRADWPLRLAEECDESVRSAGGAR